MRVKNDIPLLSIASRGWSVRAAWKWFSRRMPGSRARNTFIDGIVKFMVTMNPIPRERRHVRYRPYQVKGLQVSRRNSKDICSATLIKGNYWEQSLASTIRTNIIKHVADAKSQCK
ncbi:hypothetical protein A0H81_07442 [Grifola frondosa]|uniref:Uncharacterized protein n=1 Tax=Grifola frondosa TaxID=5627 RepID=A0A1C7M635_GRIFR|nr:hypothetical protein A0H81_07442 [Grifola frondosa]